MAPVPRIGTEFAGFRIEGLLGRGGMGVVYRAEHPRLGVPIALKVMDPDIAMDEGFRERFVREARAAARLRHPNIIPVYDAGEWHGDLYIAMRHIDGEDLGALLGQGPLPVDETCAIGQQVASALDAAHRSGVVHRDVKPGNILLEPGPEPDSGPTAFLADLGLTKQVGSAGGVTGSGDLVGTIDYIAPEQISGSRIDGRADVYSLACVLFECLTGSRPYPREERAAVLWAHMHDEVPHASSVSPALPPAVDAALARGMAKSPDDRFTTARELVQALRAPAEDPTLVRRSDTKIQPAPGAEPAPSEPPGPAPPAGRHGARAVALGAAVGLLLGGIAAGGTVFLVSDDDAPVPETVTERSPADTSPEEEPAAAALTPFEEDLIQYVPDPLRGNCRRARPLSDDFDSTLACRPGRPVDSVRYAHARSGFGLHDYFTDRAQRAGAPALPAEGEPTVPDFVHATTGQCGAGEMPSVNVFVSGGLSVRQEMAERVPLEDRLGYVLCHRRSGLARIEWTTIEIGVYAVAAGRDATALYNWWRSEGGPEP
jgi:serine/threonine-protein kinase